MRGDERRRERATGKRAALRSSLAGLSYREQASRVQPERPVFARPERPLRVEDEPAAEGGERA